MGPMYLTYSLSSKQGTFGADGRARTSSPTSESGRDIAQTPTGRQRQNLILLQICFIFCKTSIVARDLLYVRKLHECSVRECENGRVK